MTTDVATRVCANEACQYGATGKCVEGNSVDECPHLEAADHINGGPGEDVEKGTEVDTGYETSISYGH